MIRQCNCLRGEPLLNLPLPRLRLLQLIVDSGRIFVAAADDFTALLATKKMVPR